MYDHPPSGDHKGPPHAAPLPSPLRIIRFHFGKLMCILPSLLDLTGAPQPVFLPGAGQPRLQYVKPDRQKRLRPP